LATTFSWSVGTGTQGTTPSAGGHAGECGDNKNRAISSFRWFHEIDSGVQGDYANGVSSLSPGPSHLHRSPRSFPTSRHARPGAVGGLFVLVLAATLTLAFTHALSAAEPVQRTETVLTRDGLPLATDITLPEAEGSYPVILVRTPYDKKGVAGLAREGASRGFAVVAQDTRGRFASGGDNLPFHLDGPDGADTLAWIRMQPWSNGRIGTWGGSAGAITQFQLATTDAPPVEAQFLVVGAPNLHEVVYTGGIFRKALIEDWLKGTRFAPEALKIWESHPTYDDYWRQRDASRHYHRTQAAAIHVGGWWDIFAQPTLDAFVGYQERGGRGARGRQKLLMGPWTHSVLQPKAGDLTFPQGHQPPGQVHDSWRWFEHVLKDLPNGADADPAVTYYVIGDVDNPQAPGNTWRTADTWPPFQTEPTPIYLHGNGSLSFEKPKDHPPLEYLADPADLVPTVGGIQLTLPAGPKDQRPIEDRADVLVFTSEPLSEPLEVTGRVRARLWVASDAPDTDFFARLCVVYPDGRSFNLCEGMLRARFRHGLDREQPLGPEKVTPVDLDLWSTSVIFNRGHRLRVHITSSSSPGFDPNPNTGEPFRQSARTQVARNRVFVDGEHPSHLQLPMVR
jgi:predicted acyl esterase